MGYLLVVLLKTFWHIGEASSINKQMELFNDIHGDSGSYLRQTVSSISLQRLATIGFTGTNGKQSHPPTYQIIEAANDIHD